MVVSFLIYIKESLEKDDRFLFVFFNVGFCDLRGNKIEDKRGILVFASFELVMYL